MFRGDEDLELLRDISSYNGWEAPMSGNVAENESCIISSYMVPLTVS